MNTPEMMKLGASVGFGVAAILLAKAGYGFMRADKLSGLGARDPSQRRAEKRQKALEDSPFYVVLLALLRVPAEVLSRLDVGALRAYMHDPYTKAGYPGGLDDDEVVALGILLSLATGAVAAFLILAFVGPLWAIVGLLFAPLGLFMLVATFQNIAERRQHQILMAMPYVLDLLVLILRAGTSLNLALARVVADYADHPVGEELGQMLAEIEMGAPRAEAMRRLAARLSQPDINALADSMVQSEELGWPLGDTLARQADRMAAERVLNAQAKAGAAGVWVMLPSTLVLLGAVLLLFAPVIVRFMRGEYAMK